MLYCAMKLLLILNVIRSRHSCFYLRDWYADFMGYCSARQKGFFEWSEVRDFDLGMLNTR